MFAGEPALDLQVREIPPDGVAQGRGAAGGLCSSRHQESTRQPSTDASGVCGMPCASATGPYVTAPS